MRTLLCRRLRSMVASPSPRMLGSPELHRPATAPPPQQPPSAAVNGDPFISRRPFTTLNQISILRGLPTAGKNDSQGFITAAFWLHNHRQPRSLACNVGSTRGFSSAAAAATLLPSLALFWHINHGVQEILADYVHQEITRNLVVICLRLFLIIVAKDVFLSFVY